MADFVTVGIGLLKFKSLTEHLEKIELFHDTLGKKRVNVLLKISLDQTQRFAVFDKLAATVNHAINVSFNCHLNESFICRDKAIKMFNNKLYLTCPG